MPPDRLFSIERVAELARIELTPDNVAQAQLELQRVLDFIAVLDELELSGIEPFFGTMEILVLTDDPSTRHDEVQPGTLREEILGNAPDQDGEYYHVPPVFE